VQSLPSAHSAVEPAATDEARSARPTENANPRKSAAHARPEPTLGELTARGDEFAANGDHSQAVRAFRKAVELAPENGDLYGALGRSLSNLKGYHKEAEKALRKAIELDPTNSRHLVALARLYQGFGRKRDARELAIRALAEDPESTEAQDLVGALPDRDALSRDTRAPEEPGLLRRLFKRETK
jgi:Flp pilus assembly protein TadD